MFYRSKVPRKAVTLSGLGNITPYFKKLLMVLTFRLIIVSFRAFLKSSWLRYLVRISSIIEWLMTVRGVGFEPTNLYRIGASGLRL